MPARGALCSLKVDHRRGRPLAYGIVQRRLPSVVVGYTVPPRCIKSGKGVIFSGRWRSFFMANRRLSYVPSLVIRHFMAAMAAGNLPLEVTCRTEA